jgi:beta-N-acetylhexosaminidase
VAAIVGLAATLSLETRFRLARARVLATDTVELEKLGRHFIVGYRDPAEIDRLIERRALGGVFVSARNVEGLSAGAIRRQIDRWQDQRRRQDMPPLWIATDQEGGAVSRLSPPLPRQPPIASVVAQFPDKEAR